MAKLNLNFLDRLNDINQPSIIDILDGFGKEIVEYGKEYFSHVITTTSNEGYLNDFSLYIVAPEIGFEYKVITVEIINAGLLKIEFHTLVTKQVEIYSVNIVAGFGEYEEKLSEILSNSLFNASLSFIVNQIQIKRANKYEINTPTVIKQSLKQDVIVKKDLQLDGIISGDIEIIPSAAFTLNGILDGKVYVSQDASFYLNGIMTGEIINSGYCEIHGVLNGKLIEQGGRSHIAKSAVINLD